MAIKIPLFDDERRHLLTHGAVFGEDGTIEMPDGQWGCCFCAGTGYENYPDQSRPCRVRGHKERADNMIFHARSSGSSLE